jgi:hypothetical protein
LGAHKNNGIIIWRLGFYTQNKSPSGQLGLGLEESLRLNHPGMKFTAHASDVRVHIYSVILPGMHGQGAAEHL